MLDNDIASALSRYGYSLISKIWAPWCQGFRLGWALALIFLDIIILNEIRVYKY